MAASRFFTLRSFVRCMVIAFPFGGALLGVRAADTGCSLLFFSVKINQNADDDSRKGNNHKNIFHHNLPAAYAFLVLFKAYSVFNFLFVLQIKPMITAAKTTTAASPASAAPTFKVSGAVMSVPMV